MSDDLRQPNYPVYKLTFLFCFLVATFVCMCSMATVAWSNYCVNSRHTPLLTSMQVKREVDAQALVAEEQPNPVMTIVVESDNTREQIGELDYPSCYVELRVGDEILDKRIVKPHIIDQREFVVMRTEENGAAWTELVESGQIHDVRITTDSDVVSLRAVAYYLE